LAVITSSDEAFTYRKALSLEWHIKYPTNKRPRPKQYNGALGRLSSLDLVLKNPKFEGLDLRFYVDDDFLLKVPSSLKATHLSTMTITTIAHTTNATNAINATNATNATTATTMTTS